MLLIFLEKLAAAGFPDRNSAALIIGGALDLRVSGDGCVLIKEALAFTLSVSPWLPVHLSLVAQTLHPTREHLLASTPGPWAFWMLTLDMDLHGTLP
ncbi:hypothetical protein H920_11551 [Fukomys damarensis]|uniref:Uncharacterized protein n=1 Tax=Fukomys damarensis TaxID=885580 RepID=A0A091DW80_FUKDA|nr:hypothetical protein H920_11551 [Fukomys damarensis]